MMARKIVVEMVDDLDGVAGEDVTTVGFALDGRSYEIDLNGTNAQQLREILAKFVVASRRSSSDRARRIPRAAGATHDSGDRERAHTIRQWAREGGYSVANRGRIPASVVEAYEQAQQASTPAATTVKAARKATGKAGKIKKPKFSG
jgi:hypothetical protein